MSAGIPAAGSTQLRLPCACAVQVIDHLKKRYGKQAARVLNVVLGSKGGVSGGTIARWAGSGWPPGAREMGGVVGRGLRVG